MAIVIIMTTSVAVHLLAEAIAPSFQGGDFGLDFLDGAGGGDFGISGLDAGGFVFLEFFFALVPPVDVDGIFGFGHGWCGSVEGLQ